MTNTTAVQTLIAYYGTAEAVEDSGLAYRLFGEWILLDGARNVAANIRKAN